MMSFPTGPYESKSVFNVYLAGWYLRYQKKPTELQGSLSYWMSVEQGTYDIPEHDSARFHHKKLAEVFYRAMLDDDSENNLENEKRKLTEVLSKSLVASFSWPRTTVEYSEKIWDGIEGKNIYRWLPNFCGTITEALLQCDHLTEKDVAERSKVITDLHVWTSSLTLIPISQFTRLSSLKVDGFSLLRRSSFGVTDTVFAPLSKLKRLQVSWCNDTRFTDEAFRHLSNLTHLRLDNCQQPTITSGAFEHLSALKSLSLEDCDQDAIGDEAFVHLGRLESLQINRCNQTTITDQAFQFLRGLTWLDISCCRQSTITDEALRPLTNLSYLFMNECNTRRITNRAFTHLSSVIGLSMEHCKQRTITDEAFRRLGPQLRTLNIRNCKQSKITDEAFRFFTGLRNLNMKHCNQKTITDDAFRHLLSLTRLDMLGCNQTTITKNAFHHISNIDVVDARLCQSGRLCPITRSWIYRDEYHVYIPGTVSWVQKDNHRGCFLYGLKSAGRRRQLSPLGGLDETITLPIPSKLTSSRLLTPEDIFPSSDDSEHHDVDSNNKKGSNGTDIDASLENESRQTDSSSKNEEEIQADDPFDETDVAALIDVVGANRTEVIVTLRSHWDWLFKPLSTLREHMKESDIACHPLSIMQKLDFRCCNLITIANGALSWLVIGLALNPDTDTFCSQSRLASYVKRQLCSQNDGKITVLAGDDQKALVVRVSSFRRFLGCMGFRMNRCKQIVSPKDNESDKPSRSIEQIGKPFVFIRCG